MGSAHAFWTPRAYARAPVWDDLALALGAFPDCEAAFEAD